MTNIWLNPFKKLPNIREFKITVTGLDRVLLRLGIKKNYEPLIESSKNNNQSINRYIMHQIGRLHHYTENKHTYWRLCEHILRKSESFFVLGLWEVKPKWHRDLSLKHLFDCIKEYRNIRENMFEIDINYKRVYIPKPGSKELRPLGVPTLAWRIYLHILNHMLVIFYREELMSSNQHGFIPSRGTLTAWQSILLTVIWKKYIWEFDLEKFFDSVNPSAVSEKLMRRIPMKYVNMIDRYNRSPVRLPRKELLDETIQHIKSSDKEFYGSSNNWILNSFGHHLKSLSKVIPGPIKMSATSAWTNKTLSRPVQQGLAQGCPTSPFLTGLLLIDLMKKRGEHLLYADDGLIYSDEPFDPSELMQGSDWSWAGVKVKDSKSKWIKYDGVWLTPLKFLGMEYNGVLNQWKSSTRKGESLLMDQWDILIIHKNKLLEELLMTYKPLALRVVRLLLSLGDWGLANKWFSSLYDLLENVHLIRTDSTNWSSMRASPKSNWESLIKSHLLGYVQSRMYLGEWNPDLVRQDFTLSFKHASWIWSYKTLLESKRLSSPSPIVEETQLDIFNSSSVASKSLLNYLKGKRNWLSGNYLLRRKQLDPRS